MNDEHNHRHQERADRAAGASLAAFSIKRPVTISMIFVSLVVLGLISAGRIPLVLLPDVTFPGLFIWAPYANSSPRQTQEEITKPIEEVLATIPGVQRLSASSSAETAELQVFFKWGEDVDFLRAEVREKIDQIRNDLPDDLRQIAVRTFGTEDQPILFATISSAKDLRSSYDFLDVKIKKPIERVPGVAEVEFWGAYKHQLDIYLRLDDLRRYKVDVASLFRRLDESNLNVSLGRVEDGGRRYGAVAKGAVSAVEQIANFPVNDKGLLLKDIAVIEFDNPNVNQGQHLNGRYGVGFQLKKSSGANTVETLRAVHEVIDGLNADPTFEGVEMHVWHDAAKEIVNSLTGLLQAGTFGAILAVVTLWFFLRRLDASLVVGLAIPFSIIAALGMLYLGGNTLNILSMMGLMLSAGMLVDNAVVVLESIYQKLEKGFDRETAAREGAGEVTTAVVASTLTSIIIFVPLVFGPASQMSIFLGHAGRSIIFALLCSLFISLTLIPLAMARFIRVDVERKSRFERAVERALAPLILRAGRLLFGGRPDTSAAPRDGWVTRRYLQLVDWPLKRRFLCGLVLVPLLIAASSWVLMNKVKDNSPDAQELSAVNIDYDFTENYHYAKIEADYVVPVEAFLEENKARFKITDYLTRYSNNNANTEIFFDKEAVSFEEMQEIRNLIREGLPTLPGAEIKITGQGADSRGFINASVYGEDPAELTRIGNELSKRLIERDGFTEAWAGDDDAREEVQIRVDRARARRYGVSPEAVAGVLAIVVRGRPLRGFRTPDGEVEMQVRLDTADLQDMNDLRRIVVGAGADGAPIELQHVADFNVEKIAGRIRREDRRTYTFLTGVYSGEKKDDGRKIFSEVLKGYPFPDGYGWSFGFWTRQEEAESMDMVFNLLLALFMVYFVMASLFESAAHPFAIMLSLPFSIVGIAGFLWVSDTPFNIMARIGILILVGIVVNNGIVLIDHVNNLRRRGLPRAEAVREGCRERLRPIAMTAATTIVGLAPLAFGDSNMAGLRYFPMARTVMGGLLASTVLTLIVLPTYYTLVDDLGIYLRTLWRRSSPAATPYEPAPGD